MKKLVTMLSAAAVGWAALTLSRMAWLREPMRGVHNLDDYLTGNLTVGTKKKQWVMSQPGEIYGIRVNSETAGTTGSAVIDVMLNGTTIFTTAANRPTLATGVAGDYTVSPPDGTIAFKAGDVIRYDVISASTTPQTNTAVNIITRRT